MSATIASSGLVSSFRRGKSAKEYFAILSCETNFSSQKPLLDEHNDHGRLE
jgi:hypothetical protein